MAFFFGILWCISGLITWFGLDLYIRGWKIWFVYYDKWEFDSRFWWLFWMPFWVVLRFLMLGLLIFPVTNFVMTFIIIMFQDNHRHSIGFDEISTVKFFEILSNLRLKRVK